MNKALKYIKNIKRLPQDLSNRKEPVYQEIKPFTRDKEGKFITFENSMLKKIDEIDIQDKINSYREDTDLYTILKNISQGYTPLERLNKNNGVYMDVSGVPNDFHNLYKAKEKADKSFASLTPDDLKSLRKVLNLVSEKKDESQQEQIIEKSESEV